MRLPEPGQLFENRYRIERELGAGGFSRVFRAFDQRAGRPVALKILLPDDGGYDRATLKRFEREVAIVAKLTNPHTVTLFERGTSSNGLLFMALELVPGEDLSEVLAREGRLPAATVRAILVQVLDSLREAHAAGLIHRDIKPDNIRVFSGPDEPIQVKLLDFGIARGTDDGAPTITKTGELIGTPRYMSPEQLTERPLTPRSDIYSLGMVAFELLVGADALAGNSWSAQFERLLTGHMFGVELVGQIGPELLQIVQRMTARDPQDRFPSAAAVLSELRRTEPGARDRGIHTGQRASATASTQIARRPRTSLPAVVILVVAIAVVVAAVLLVYGSRDEESPPTAALPVAREGPSALLKGSAEEPPAPDLGSAAQVPDGGLDGGAERGHDVGASERGTSGCGVETPFSVPDLVVRGPDPYDPEVPHPAIVWLNADYEPPSLVADSDSMKMLIQQEGVFVIAPSHNSTWRAQDVEYITQKVQAAMETYCLDRERIFVIANGGSGNAGMRLSCEPWVRAMAVNSYLGPAQMIVGCKPEIWLTAKDSTHLPIEGGRSCLGTTVESYANIENRLLATHRCRPRPALEKEEHGTCQRWRCDVPLQTCMLDGGIGWSRAPRPFASKFAQLSGGCDEQPPADFPTTERVWRFFQSVSDEPQTE